MEAPKFSPLNLTAVPKDSKSIRVTWSIPSNVITKNHLVEGFYIGYKIYSSLDSYTYKTMHISPQEFALSDSISESSLNNPFSRPSFTYNSQSGRSYEYLIDLLHKSTKYVVIIQAFNSRGAGPSSQEVTVETFANGMSFYIRSAVYLLIFNL